jgi:hypothetical protein
MQNYNEQMGTLTGKVTSIAATERFNANGKGYFVSTVECVTKSGETRAIVANMPRKVFDTGVKINSDVTVAISKDANGGLWANVIGSAGTVLSADILADFDLAAPREQKTALDVLFGK